MKAEARAHLERGLKLYEESRFEEAIGEFLAGQAIEPHSEFLYALGQSERRKGDCAAAVNYYRAYLQAAPSSQQASAVRFQIDRCDPDRASRPGSAEIAAPNTNVPTVGHDEPAPTLTASAGERRRRFYEDWVGDTLCGVGAAGVITGALLMIRGGQAIDEGHSRYDLYYKVADGEHERTVGAIAMAASGALIVSGLVRYYMISSRRAVITAQVSEGAAQLVVVGRF
jgi:hypothetical protein